MQENPTQPIDPAAGPGVDPPASQAEGPAGDQGPGMRRTQWIGFIGGAIVFLLILVLQLPRVLRPRGGGPGRWRHSWLYGG